MASQFWAKFRFFSFFWSLPLSLNLTGKSVMKKLKVFHFGHIIFFIPVHRSSFDFILFNDFFRDVPETFIITYWSSIYYFNRFFYFNLISWWGLCLHSLYLDRTHKLTSLSLALQIIYSDQKQVPTMKKKERGGGQRTRKLKPAFLRQKRSSSDDDVVIRYWQ